MINDCKRAREATKRKRESQGHSIDITVLLSTTHAHANTHPHTHTRTHTRKDIYMTGEFSASTLTLTPFPADETRRDATQRWESKVCHASNSCPLSPPPSPTPAPAPARFFTAPRPPGFFPEFQQPQPPRHSACGDMCHTHTDVT